MNRRPLLFLAALVAINSHAAEPAAPDDCCKFNLWTGEGINLGGILYPEINYQTAFGTSSIDPARLAVGHHDPNRRGVTQQNVEFSLGARLGHHVRLFGNYNAVIDHDDHWVAEFEEHYAVFSGLPLGAQLKGGRFFTRFGYENERHLHDFTLIDKLLPNGRLIGEDSAAVYGAELSLPLLRGLPARWDDRLTISYGAVPDPEEEEEEDGPESRFEAEGALLQDWAVTADYTLGFAATKATRYELGISGMWGRNDFERQTQLYGLHLDYLWRPEGAAGADSCCHKDNAEFFRWRTELFVRHFGAANGEGQRDDFTDAGLYTILSYGFPQGKVQAHLRGEYVSGVADAGLPERWRASPAVTWRPTERLPVHFKLQYNCDYSPSFGNEHSVWLQCSLTWGDCCAHEH